MAERSAPQPLILLPTASADAPKWSRVGAVALAGFLLGLLTPRLLGLELGPSPPEDLRAVVSSSASVARPLAPSASADALPSSLPASTMEAVTVARGVISECRDRSGDAIAGTSCDAPDFDALVQPALASLARCSGASGVSAHLTINLEADFVHHSLRAPRTQPRPTSLPGASFRTLLGCAEAALKGVSIDALGHQHSRYSVTYGLTLTSPAAMSAPGASASPAASATETSMGSAVVVWNSCLVRESPKTGAVVGKVTKGDKLTLLEQQADWYRVRAGATSGWVFGEAIGK